MEGIFHHPGGRNLPAAVICHPHSLYGGSMDVSLVVSIARTLAERGIIALRFNFRGVGQSEGTFGEGVGEGTDHFLIGREKEVAEAVADFIEEHGHDRQRNRV